MYKYIFRLLLISICFAHQIFFSCQVFAGEETNGDGFSFVVLGHVRGETSGELSMYYEEIIETISELNPDLIIMTGDMIWGFTRGPAEADAIRAEWDKFDAGFNTLGIPVYRLPGNHDVFNNTSRDIYFDRYNKVPFAFTFKQSRFILLDTMSLDQYKIEDQTSWTKAAVKPFNDVQLEFIQNEIQQQQEFDHVFVFMHHPQPWSKPSGFWWKDVHPQLVNGKVRAVFAGSPLFFKYAHQERDGIHYILSSSGNDPSVEMLKQNPNPTKYAFYKQMNNFQYVRVDGKKYSIQTIVVGALTSKSLSWEFWDQIENRSQTWSKQMAFLFHKKFYRLRNLFIFQTIWGSVCFFSGLLVAVVWIRHRKKLK